MTLNAIDTLAFAGIVLFMGYGLRRMLPVLGRLNIPVPVIGGLLISLAVTVARTRGVTLVSFDTTWQSPLMIAFFASIGFGASISLLRAGGPLVLLFSSSRPAVPSRRTSWARPLPAGLARSRCSGSSRARSR